MCLMPFVGGTQRIRCELSRCVLLLWFSASLWSPHCAGALNCLLMKNLSFAFCIVRATFAPGSALYIPCLD